jgi:hypothetical protein
MSRILNILCIMFKSIFVLYDNAVRRVKCESKEYLSMAPPKDHAVGDLLIVAKLEFIWFICCILMENS